MFESELDFKIQRARNTTSELCVFGVNLSNIIIVKYSCYYENMFNTIMQEFQNFSQVKAIAVGGSTSAETSDNKSDVDVYIFVEQDIPINARKNIIKKFSSKYEVGCEYFGSGDEFLVDSLNLQLDIMYWNTNWFENIVENVWFKHYAANGYTTAFLYTLKNFNIIYDRDDWLLNLKNSINTQYPEELKQNIINRNMMLLKDKPFASYYEQIEKAVLRNDIVSINHRISAFLASYFDIIFAINELLHPGEKRLIQYAINNCKILPKDFEENIRKLLELPNSEKLFALNLIIKELRLTI